jgi:hypothetical protein
MVKPWFNGPDRLRARGRRLHAGRISRWSAAASDYIGGRPVAVSGCTKATPQHLVNVFVWPHAADGRTKRRTRYVREGFHPFSSGNSQV